MLIWVLVLRIVHCWLHQWYLRKLIWIERLHMWMLVPLMHDLHHHSIVGILRLLDVIHIWMHKLLRMFMITTRFSLIYHKLSVIEITLLDCHLKKILSQSFYRWLLAGSLGLLYFWIIDQGFICSRSWLFTLCRIYLILKFAKSWLWIIWCRVLDCFLHDCWLPWYYRLICRVSL